MSAIQFQPLCNFIKTYSGEESDKRSFVIENRDQLVQFIRSRSLMERPKTPEVDFESKKILVINGVLLDVANHLCIKKVERKADGQLQFFCESIRSDYRVGRMDLMGIQSTLLLVNRDENLDPLPITETQMINDIEESEVLGQVDPSARLNKVHETAGQRYL